MARYSRAGLGNRGPHGLTEVVYALLSATGNNGSAFAGLNTNSAFYQVVTGIAMTAGRYLLIAGVLVIAGSIVERKRVASGLGTFPTDGATFGALFASVVVIVGLLTYLPALALGPVAEQLIGDGARF